MQGIDRSLMIEERATHCIRCDLSPRSQPLAVAG